MVSDNDDGANDENEFGSGDSGEAEDDMDTNIE